MPEIELHADFDRDGRITGSRIERLARRTWPGVIVVPNVDRDARLLPRASATRRQAILAPDAELPTPAGRDDELVRLEIRIASGALAHSDQLRLRCGTMAGRLRLDTRDGDMILEHPGVPGDFDLPPMPSSGELALDLQVLTPAGSLRGTDAGLEAHYRSDADEESRFELSIVRVDASGRETVEDHGCFTVAPVILADSTAPVSRLYAVARGGNAPSISDLRDAAEAAGVPLEVIGSGVENLDPWIQDQYQLAFLQGTRRVRQLVWHLPRYRALGHDPAQVDTLAEFVDSHFRSRDIGVDRELWTRRLVVRTTDGSERRLDLGQIGMYAEIARGIEAALVLVQKLMVLVDPTVRVRRERDIGAAALQLSALLSEFTRVTSEMYDSASDERIDFLVSLIMLAHESALGALAPVRVTESEVMVQLEDAAFSLDHESARRLAVRAVQIADTAVYGGNIESTSPVSGAPLGKILVGNRADPETGAEFVDPDVLRFLAKQRKQPLVELDTTWLLVGHVDEMLAIVPGARRGFSVVHASSHAAAELLREAVALHRSGLTTPAPTEWPPPAGDRPRLMTDGAHPVTRLLRGKPWIHTFLLRPPAIFLVLADAFMSSPVNQHGIGFVVAEESSHGYAADITAEELIHCERDPRGESTNDAIDRFPLEASRNTLARELGVPILPIPVLYDRVTDAGAYGGSGQVERTAAFLPNMSNLAVLDRHLLVPRPYGPRMLVADAITIVRRVMSTVGMPGSVRARVGSRLAARHRMTRAVYWVQRFRGATASAGGDATRTYRGMLDANDVIETFRDSFPGADDDEIERQVIQRNRRWFRSSGALRHRFSRLVFDDGMVDLFELWMVAVAEELGTELHFVDSWSYHLLHGEIHCGTNVLRRPVRVGGIDSWDAPDHEFRSTVGRSRAMASSV